MIRTNVWITQQQIRNTHTFNQFKVLLSSQHTRAHCHPSPHRGPRRAVFARWGGLAEDLLLALGRAFALVFAVAFEIGQGFSLGILTHHKSGFSPRDMFSYRALNRLLKLLGDFVLFYRSKRRTPGLVEETDNSNNCKYSANQNDTVDEIDIWHNQSRLTSCRISH
jgi:hypothetical protein